MVDALLENKCELLLKLYETQSLTEIANQYQCNRCLLAKKLKKIGVLIKRWDEKTHRAQSHLRDLKLPWQIRDPVWLRTEYLNKQRGIDDIASSTGCSITAVRNRLRKFGVPIRPQLKFGHGRKIPKTTRGVSILYHSKHGDIRFRSILECGFAIYLDNNKRIKSWDYESSWIWYLDGFSGKERKYLCDFKIQYRDGQIEHIEVKPLDLQYSSDKYLNAQNQLQGWRWITKEEIQESEESFSQPNLPIEFPNELSQTLKKFVIWSKENNLTMPDDYRILSKRLKYKHYYRYGIINDKLFEKHDKIVTYNRPSDLKHINSVICLNLEEILDLIKKDFSVKQIGKQYGVDYRTISKFLEDRSYVVRWGGSSSKHNEIRYATKLLWPLEELSPKLIQRNRANYEWDNYVWLYQKYVTEGLSTRKIGHLVQKSGRLILKKLRKHNVKIRTCFRNTSK